MPTYDYQCRQCGAVSEVIHGMTADPPTQCEVCGGGPLRRVFHPAGIIFKGSGFYSTDSRRASSSSSSASSGSGKKADAASPGAAASDGATQSGGDKRSEGAKHEAPGPVGHPTESGSS